MAGELLGYQVPDLRQLLESLSLEIDGKHVTPQPSVVDTALAIADIFSELCRIRVGRSPSINRKNAHYYYKAALLCLRLGETPQLFVAKQLRGMTQYSKFWVTSLSSEKLHQSVDAEVNITLEAVRYYKSQLALFSSRCRLCGPTVAIQDTANEFSPLFRYIVASELGLKETSDKYRTEALQELNLNPVARDVFGTRLGCFGNAADRAALPSIVSADSTLAVDS